MVQLHSIAQQAIRGFTEVVKQLLKAGADVNAEGTIGRFTNYTPLSMAVEMDRCYDAGSEYKVVIELLKRYDE